MFEALGLIIKGFVILWILVIGGIVNLMLAVLMAGMIATALTYLKSHSSQGG